MKRLLSLSSILILVSIHCATSVEGISVRARSPLISEVSRRISLALRADDYVIEKGSIHDLYQMTGWRPLKENEMSRAEREGARAEGKVEVRLLPRGSQYDILLTIRLRAGDGEYLPDVNHPMVVKWQNVLNELVETEPREGD